MKKLIAMIASISVFACMSVSALAATPEASTEDISYAEATGFTVDADDVASTNSQTTIVVIEGVGVDKVVNGETVKTYDISTSSIQYINQSADTSFTLIPKSHTTYLESAKDVTLTVLIGGDKINKTELGTITYKAPVATKAKIKGTITGFLPETTVLPTLTITDAEGKENAVTVNADGSFEFEAAAGTYELVATKPYHCGYTMSDIVVSTSDVVINPTVFVGDINEDEFVDSMDYSPILAYYDAMEGDENWDEISMYDINEDTFIDSMDYSPILANYDAEAFYGEWSN